MKKKHAGDLVRLTILVDNNAAEGLAEEHGFALLIETKEQKILFDTGQGNALVPNAEKLSIDLSRVDSLVLSHGHYDHTGGVPAFFRKKAGVVTFAHPAIFNSCFSIKNGAVKSVSIAPTVAALLSSESEEQIKWCSMPRMITSTVGVTGAIPRKQEVGIKGQFFVDMSGSWPDKIEADIALWFESNSGLVVVTGCCHAGLINTLEYVRFLNKNRSIYAVIGGFHLHSVPDSEINQICNALLEHDIKMVVPCHCTGADASAHMAQLLPGRVTIGMSGTEMLF